MATFAKFFGCDANSILQRTLDDNQPLAFSWDYNPEPTTIQAEVSFDNTEYVDTIGAVVNLTNNTWQLEFEPQDRPTNAGLITYKFTDDLGNTEELLVEFVGEPSTPQLPEVDTTYSKYGPKRVKTKEMEIEQFDPRVLQDLEDRKTRCTPPTFANSRFAVGRNQEEC